MSNLQPILEASGSKRYEEAPAGYFAFARPELRRLIPGSVRKVLDVGCGGGHLGRALKEERPGISVTGVEAVPEAAKEAEIYLDEVLLRDLNGDLDLPYPEGHFDALVFGDVLEHLMDPEGALRRLGRYLAPVGVIVSSIPNVKHWSVLIPLLGEDRWEYTDAGLLDRTHVHLFTGSEAMQMFVRAGFGRLQRMEATVIEPPQVGMVEPLVRASVSFGAAEGACRSQLSIYQYLMVCGRP